MNPASSAIHVQFCVPRTFENKHSPPGSFSAHLLFFKSYGTEGQIPGSEYHTLFYAYTLVHPTA